MKQFSCLQTIYSVVDSSKGHGIQNDLGFGVYVSFFEVKNTMIYSLSLHILLGEIVQVSLHDIRVLAVLPSRE